MKQQGLAIPALLDHVHASADRKSFLLLMRAYAKKRRYEELMEVAGSYLSHRGLASIAHASYAAGLLLKTDDLNRALEFFKRAAKLPGLGRQQTPASLIVSPEEFMSLGAIDLGDSCNPISILNVPGEQPRFVMCATGDERYFRAFFEIYRDTFFEHNPDASYIIHFHIFDPGAELLEEIRAWTGKTCSRICFSVENTGAMNRSYYYVGRFVQMPRLLAHYRCPIAVSDIDCVFTSGVDELLETTSNSDIGIWENEARFFPWERFRAGLVVFNPTPDGFAFSKTLRNFLIQVRKDRLNYWWIDQLGLAECAYLNRNLGFGAVAPIAAAYGRICFQDMRRPTGFPDDKAISARDFLNRREQLDDDASESDAA